ncbi:MAG: 23S rRNA (guanosine(2251)-2'-O)-methyltransferase RlmB [Coriobacteriia bacterium]|nr:23S rRNA (guanosine(2251)-2'-O)-methyltransferase RlmB [Coriobacteriia bacterium]
MADCNYIEGRRAVEEALRAGVPIRRALVVAPGQDRETAAKGTGKQGKAGRADDAAAQTQAQGRRGRNQRPPKPTGADAALERIILKLRRQNIRIEFVERKVLDRISLEGESHGAHQGIICEVPHYQYSSLMDIARAGASKDESLVLVLDHITDEGNLGAIIRTAEVMGADGVIIPNARAAQVGVGVYKTSAGAALHLPIARVSNLAGALDVLKEAGFWVAGASEQAKQDIWHAPLRGRLVIVAGSEGEGISRLVREKCDFLVALPQRGHVGSLNVAQATTAVCYEWMRQCGEAAQEAQRKAAAKAARTAYEQGLAAQGGAGATH